MASLTSLARMRERPNHSMPGKSKTSRNADRARTDVDKGLRAEAKRAAAAYQIILRFADGLWHGRGLELPQVCAVGISPEACLTDTREALAAAIMQLLENNRRPPAAATAGRRTEQVNVRLTAEEKVLLEASAKRQGFNALSDFIRAAALEATTK